jgi:hypothetical protein
MRVRGLVCLFLSPFSFSPFVCGFQFGVHLGLDSGKVLVHTFKGPMRDQMFSPA